MTGMLSTIAEAKPTKMLAVVGPSSKYRTCDTTARYRILHERTGIGTAPLFPSPQTPRQPIGYELAAAWLREAGQLANVEPHDGSLWHAYRRGWATSRKHLPDADVAAAGGWKSTETLRRVYQQPYADTMLRVVLEPGLLREAK